MKDRQRAIGMRMHPDGGFDVVATVIIGRNLKRHVVVAHAVVVAHDTRLLHTQDLVQVGADEGHEGGARFAGRDAELPVKRRQEAAFDVLVGGGRGVIPASASSRGSRSCQVLNMRSDRPRACGE